MTTSQQTKGYWCYWCYWAFASVSFICKSGKWRRFADARRRVLTCTKVSTWWAVQNLCAWRPRDPVSRWESQSGPNFCVLVNWKVREKLWKTAQDLIWCELLDVRTLHLMSSDLQLIIQTVLQSSLFYIHYLSAFKVLRKLEASSMVLNCALSAYMDLWQVNHVLDIGTLNAFDTFMHHAFKKCY